MSFEKLQEFIDLAKRAGVSALEYESDKEKFSVEFPQSAVIASPIRQTIEKVESKPTPVSNNSGTKEITSPYVGTFYRSSAPDRPAFVKVGDKVSKGQVICLIEAMKNFIEVESDIAGEVVEFCADNESYVEFGEVLCRIRPS